MSQYHESGLRNRRATILWGGGTLILVIVIIGLLIWFEKMQNQAAIDTGEFSQPIQNVENNNTPSGDDNNAPAGGNDNSDDPITTVHKINLNTISRVHSDCVVITWDEVDGYDEYELMRATGDGQFRKIADVSEPYYYDWEASEGKEYRYRISTKDGIYTVSDAVGYNQKNTTSVACLMYHYFASEEDIANGAINNSGTILLSEIEEDLKYFNENNIKTITSSDLIAFLNGEISLPERCVMISVDDAHYSIYKYLQPLLEEYNCKANVAIIGAFTDAGEYRNEANQSNYWMTWSEIAELKEKGYIEFGSHSYDLHQTNPDTGRYGTRILPGESFEDYQNVLVADNEKMLAQLRTMDINPTFFAFPYNDPCAEARTIFPSAFDYSFLFVGDSDYFVKTRSNYFVNGVGVDQLDNMLVRRVARRTGDDLSVLLENIWSNIQ